MFGEKTSQKGPKYYLILARKLDNLVTKKEALRLFY